MNIISRSHTSEKPDCKNIASKKKKPSNSETLFFTFCVCGKTFTFRKMQKEKRARKRKIFPVCEFWNKFLGTGNAFVLGRVMGFRRYTPSVLSLPRLRRGSLPLTMSRATRLLHPHHTVPSSLNAHALLGFQFPKGRSRHCRHLPDDPGPHRSRRLHRLLLAQDQPHPPHPLRRRPRTYSLLTETFRYFILKRDGQRTRRFCCRSACRYCLNRRKRRTLFASRPY